MARAAVLRSLLLLAAGACGDTSIRQPAAMVDGGSVISPACMEAVDHSDLDWIQEKIFTPSCSRFTACHKNNATSAAGLNLEAGRSLGNLIGDDGLGEPSRVCALPQRLVIPGDPANSYLMKALDDPENPKYPLPGPGAQCPDGDPDEPPESMPYNNPPLCVQKRDAVERWILTLAIPDAGVPADASIPDADTTDADTTDAMPDAM